MTRADALTDVRRWIQAGLPTSLSVRQAYGLEAVAERFFGSWDAAREASGAVPPQALRELSGERRDDLGVLVGVLPIQTLSRLTGVDPVLLTAYRRRVGAPSWREQQRATIRDCGWLGKLDDGEIARRLGVTQNAVSYIRAELGIPPPPRTRLRRLFPAMDLDGERAHLRELIDGLTNERARLVLRARYLREPPRTLRDLAAELGVSTERVRQLEKRALWKLGLGG